LLFEHVLDLLSGLLAVATSLVSAAPALLLLVAGGLAVLLGGLAGQYSRKARAYRLTRSRLSSTQQPANFAPSSPTAALVLAASPTTASIPASRCSRNTTPSVSKRLAYPVTLARAHQGTVMTPGAPGQD